MPSKTATKKTATKKTAAKRQTSKPDAPRASTRRRRLEHKQRAAAAIETHSGPVLRLLADVVHELADEVEDLSQMEQDLAYCAELSHRLDKAVTFGDPLLEALDGLVMFFVAAAAIGIFRAVERHENIKASRLARLKDRLVERADKLTAGQRQRLERRIKRLEG